MLWSEPARNPLFVFGWHNGDVSNKWPVKTVTQLIGTRHSAYSCRSKKTSGCLILSGTQWKTLTLPQYKQCLSGNTSNKCIHEINKYITAMQQLHKLFLLCSQHQRVEGKSIKASKNSFTVWYNPNKPLLRLFQSYLLYVNLLKQERTKRTWTKIVYRKVIYCYMINL